MMTARQSNKNEQYKNTLSLNDAHTKGPGAYKVLGILHGRQSAILGDIGVSAMWGGNVVGVDGHD